MFVGRPRRAHFSPLYLPQTENHRDRNSPGTSLLRVIVKLYRDYPALCRPAHARVRHPYFPGRDEISLQPRSSISPGIKDETGLKETHNVVADRQAGGDIKFVRRGAELIRTVKAYQRLKWYPACSSFTFLDSPTRGR